MLKHVEFRKQRDDSVKVFGVDMPDGPLTAVTGQLIRVLHSQCYWRERKAAERGGPKTSITAWPDSTGA